MPNPIKAIFTLLIIFLILLFISFLLSVAYGVKKINCNHLQSKNNGKTINKPYRKNNYSHQKPNINKPKSIDIPLKSTIISQDKLKIK